MHTNHQPQPPPRPFSAPNEPIATRAWNTVVRQLGWQRASSATYRQHRYCLLASSRAEQENALNRRTASQPRHDLSERKAAAEQRERERRKAEREHTEWEYFRIRSIIGLERAEIAEQQQRAADRRREKRYEEWCRRAAEEDERDHQLYRSKARAWLKERSNERVLELARRAEAYIAALKKTVEHELQRVQLDEATCRSALELELAELGSRCMLCKQALGDMIQVDSVEQERKEAELRSQRKIQEEERLQQMSDMLKKEKVLRQAKRKQDRIIQNCTHGPRHTSALLTVQGKEKGCWRCGYRLNPHTELLEQYDFTKQQFR
eukprot:Sspe_Gene.101471::Locus_76058_Transcript_1_2_Confidence_0.667_Length_1652::g.101471::m.101471